MQNSSASEDLRVRRTRKLLQEALLALSVEKGFAATTVRDVCTRAMVNRSTFYRHYLDKYAILDQFMDEVQAAVREAYQLQTVVEPNKEVPAGLVALLRHIQLYPDFYRQMLGAQGDAWFIQRFRRMIEGHFRLMLANRPDDPDGPPLDLRLHFVSCADIGAILWWLESGQQWTAEQLAFWIGQIASGRAPLAPAGVVQDSTVRK